jgi:short-subunit dehydrogenase
MADRPIALVTGASSGIGRDLARVLAREGHDLVLVARREPELSQLADEVRSRYGANATVITADLADADAANKLRDAVEGHGLEVEVLVNNAGLGDHGPIWETDLDSELRVLRVNIVALTALTKVFLPGMVARGHGRVLNVASTAGFQPGPFMSVYYASKAYVLSFTEAIAEELVGTGVTATALCPGVVWTGFQETAGLDKENSPLLRSPGAKSSEYVAEAAYRGLAKGKRIVIPGMVNKVGAQSVRFSPRRVVVRITKQLHPQK